MLTDVNVNTPTGSESSSANGVIVAILILVLIVIAFWLFGAPNWGSSANPNLNPAPDTTIQNNVEPAPPVPAEGTDINVPDQIDINLEDGPRASIAP